MKTAELVEASLVSWQSTTNLYRLSQPLEGNGFVAVAVSTEPHCADDTTVFAATESGAAQPHPDTHSWWVLAHFADDTPHEVALRELGYEVR